MITNQAIAIAQGISAARQLKKLSENKPDGYHVSAEKQDVYDRALLNADRGFSPGERSQFYRNNARSINSMLREGTARGGGQASNALLSLGMDAQLSAEADLAAKDAQLKRSGLAFLDKASDPFENVTQANKARELSIYDNAVAASSELMNTAIQTGVDSIKDQEAMAIQMLSGGITKPKEDETNTGDITGGGSTTPQFAPPAPIVSNQTPAAYNTGSPEFIQEQMMMNQYNPNTDMYTDPNELRLGSRRNRRIGQNYSR